MTRPAILKMKEAFLYSFINNTVIALPVKFDDLLFL